MMYAVVKEQNIPIPHPYETRQVYQWHEMKVTECLTIYDRDYNSINVMVRRAAKRTGFKFTMRQISRSVIRVWRIV
jgi:hypothetical protein